MFAHLLWCIYLNKPAVFHDGHSIAQFEGLVDVVRDENYRFAQLPLNLQQLKLHILAHKRVQRRKGLVHQKHLRVVCQCTGNSHALAHAADRLLQAWCSQPLRPVMASTSMAFFSRWARGTPFTSSP